MTGKPMIVSLLTVGVSMVWLTPAALADTVVMKDGRTHEGRIKSEDETYLHFQVSAVGIRTTLRLPKKEIERIERGAPPKPAPKPSAKPTKPRPAPKRKPGKTAAKRASTTPVKGAFLRLDLRQAIGRESLVFPENVNDEGTDLEPLRGRILMQFPVAYRLGDKVQHITRGSFRVRTGAGRLCRGRGITLPSGTSSGALGIATPRRPTADIGINVQNPSDGDPVWERVTPKEKEGFLYIECANSSRPKEAKSRNSGPRRREPGKRGSRYDARTATGYVLFVVEVPEDTKTLQCTVKSDPPVETQFDLAFLRALTQDAGQAGPTEITATARAIASAEGSIAQALVTQLAQMPDPGAETPDLRTPGFIAALSHADPETRIAAWQALASSDTVSATTLDAIRETEDASIYETVVAGAAEELERAASDSATRPSAAVRVVRRVAGQADESNIVPSDLPESAAPPNTFTLLNAVLRSKASGNGEAAVDLVLKYPSKEGIATLSNVSRRVQGTAIDRLSKIHDRKLFVPLAKTLLLAPDPTLVQPLLQAASRMPIPIEETGDPLISAPLRVEDPVSRAALLEALAAMPLGAAFETREMGETLAACTDPTGDGRVQLAAVKLIGAHWQPAVGLPPIGGRGRLKLPTGGGLDAMLSGLIATPEVATPVATAAAMTLIRVGAPGPAAAAMFELPPERQAELIRAAAAQGADMGPQLAAFLATLAGLEEATTAKAALMALDRLVQSTPESQRWRMVTEVKAAMTFEVVIKHSVELDQESKAAAERVLAEGASLDPTQIEGLRTTVDRDSRLSHLATIAYGRAEKPAGTYHLLAFADVTDTSAASQSNGGRPGVRYNVPFDLGLVPIASTGEAEWAMHFKEQPLALKHRSSRGRRGSISIVARMEFDPKPIVAAVLAQLTTPAPPQGGLLGRLASALSGGDTTAPPVSSELLDAIDLRPLKLEHASLGRWQGEMTFPRIPAPSDGAAAPAWPLVRLRLVLERIDGPATN